MELELKTEKWRSGDYGEHQVGYGATFLLNDKGYQCCVGLMYSACGVDNGALSDRASTPRYGRNELPFSAVVINDLINVNDHPDTTPEAKKKKIAAICAKKGVTIKWV